MGVEQRRKSVWEGDYDDWQSLSKLCQELGGKVVDFVSTTFKL